MNYQRTAELISLLCAKTQAFEPAIRTFDILRTHDISLALGLVQSIPARMLIRIKYADEVSYMATFEDQLLSAIERGLLSHVEQFAVPSRWKVPRKDFLRDMCRLALVECLHPHLCWHCGGRKGAIVQSGQWEDCLACSATGFKRLSDRKRARILQVHEDAWRKNWRERYQIIQGVLDRYEELCLGGISKRLGH